MESKIDDIDNLVDINTISVNDKLSKEERVIDFMKKIQNPYCFQCNGTIVHIGFADTKRTLEDCLADYLKSRISVLDNRHEG